MNTDQTLDAVRGEWWAAEHYELFIGEKCVECGRRACRDETCLAAIRAGVAATTSFGTLAKVLGVTENKE